MVVPAQVQPNMPLLAISPLVSPMPRELPPLCPGLQQLLLSLLDSMEVQVPEEAPASMLPLRESQPQWLSTPVFCVVRSTSRARPVPMVSLSAGSACGQDTSNVIALSQKTRIPLLHEGRWWAGTGFK